MKGSECRKNLILVAISMQEKGFDTNPNTRQLFSLLVCLIELQKIAYSLAADRTPRAILRAYNQSYLFRILCAEVFPELHECTERAMYGMPMHCITTHLAEQLRLICGRSLVAEHAERYFNKLRYFSHSIKCTFIWICRQFVSQ